MQLRLNETQLRMLRQYVLSPENNYITKVKLPSMSDSLYDSLAPAIESIGGKWSEQHKSFLFWGQPQESLEKLIKTGAFEYNEVQRWKDRTQFFPTPKSVIEKMICLAELNPGDIVLEPSAGQGGILDLLPSTVAHLSVELDSYNHQILLQKGYITERADFLQYDNFNGQYNKVIMNPPFYNGQDALHIIKAFNGMKPGGTLVSIANENTLYRHTDTAKRFKLFLLENTTDIIPLEAGTFKESGTMINTYILKVKK